MLCLLLLWTAPAAHAGDHWRVTYAWTHGSYTSGNPQTYGLAYSNTSPDSFVDDGPNSGSYASYNGIGLDTARADEGASTGNLGVIIMDTVTATLTWVHDDGSQAPNPPKCVIVQEEATAEYTAMNPTDKISNTGADNGLQDPINEFDNPNSTNANQCAYDRISGTLTAGWYILVPHYSVQDGTWGTIKLPSRTLTASISSSPAPPSDDNYGTEDYATTWYGVTPCNISLTSPDPIGRPDLGDGNNQFVYGSEQPDGYLFVPGTTTVEGGTQAMAQWLINNNTIDMKVEASSISGAFSHIWSAIGSQIGVATNYTDEYGMAGSTETQWVFKGLPSQNSGFGNHAVNLYVQGTNTQSAHIQTFFNATASNYPGSYDNQFGGNAAIPNWFNYWNQTSAKYGAPVYLSGQRSNTHFAWPGGWTAYIEDDAISGPFPAYDGADGIDAFAWTCRHEAEHVELLSSWWGNFPRNNLYDSDGDNIPDRLEHNLGMQFHPELGGYDPLHAVTPGLTDHFSYGPDYNDNEDYTQHMQRQNHPWTNGSANAEDWANPGHQYH